MRSVRFLYTYTRRHTARLVILAGEMRECDARERRRERKSEDLRPEGLCETKSLLPDGGQLLLGGVLQVLDDGLVLVHIVVVVQSRSVVDVTGTGPLGAVEQSVDVLRG